MLASFIRAVGTRILPRPSSSSVTASRSLVASDRQARFVKPSASTKLQNRNQKGNGIANLKNGLNNLNKQRKVLKSLTTPTQNRAFTALPPAFSPFNAASKTLLKRQLFPQAKGIPGLTVKPVRFFASQASQAPISSVLDQPFAPTKPKRASPFSPLDEALPGMTEIPAPPETPPDIKISTLPNGIRVVTYDMYSSASAFGVYFGTGSRSARPDRQGITHILQQLGFKSTTTKSTQDILMLLDRSGFFEKTTSSRDVMIYSVECMRGNLEEAMELVADTLMNPAFTDEDFEEAKNMVSLEWEQRSFHSSMIEAMYEIAYKDQPFGQTIYCPPETVDAVTKDDLLDFMQNEYIPSNMVVAGISVDHDSFVELVKQHFGDVPAAEHPPQHLQQWVGGEGLLIEGEHEIESVREPAAHFALAFEGPGADKGMDFHAAHVLCRLLGGGSDFSTGGPGKRVFSRLYSRIMAQTNYVHSTECFFMWHQQTALFGIYGSCLPDRVFDLYERVCVEFSDMTLRISEEELARAKRLLKSTLSLGVENRLSRMDDIGKQLVSSGSVVSSTDQMAMIDQVTKEDILRVSNNIIRNTHPVFVGFGPLPSFEKLPAPLDMQQHIFKLVDDGKRKLSEQASRIPRSNKKNFLNMFKSKPTTPPAQESS